MPLRVNVVRMHLHGKVIFRKNKFYEKGNTRESRETRAGPFYRQRRPNIAKRTPGKFARGKRALIARQPRFANGFGFTSAIWK